MEVIVFFEHKVRELPALRRLRDELQGRGHSVNIYSIAFEWYDAYRRAKCHGVDVLLVPWCYRAEQFWRFSPFYELNPSMKMVNLHHEQITAKLTQSVLMPRDQVACDYPYHLCWTDYFKNALTEWNTNPDRVYVVGNLRLEPVRKDVTRRKELATQYHLDDKKRWILYAESRRIDDISIEKIRFDFHEMADLTEEECNAYFDRWKKSLSKTIEQIRCLAGEFFEKNELIYRPHPGSTINFDLGNHAKIISERPISDWLESADAFCTWQSTSAFEAELQGLPVFFHEVIDIPNSERMPGVSEYTVIKDIGELNDELIRHALQAQSTNRICSQYVGSFDANTAARYADSIEDIASRNEHLPIVPYSKRWIAKMFYSELIIRAMKPTGLIRRLHWPHTASMMYEDIPFGDTQCSDLHH